MVVGDFAEGAQVAVLGGGSGGYVAAIRAAQLGLEVVVFEKEHLGGLCLNKGCIPSKALIHASHVKREIDRADKLGISVSGAKVDMTKLMAWKDGVVGRLRNGIKTLLSKNKVTLVEGTARLEGEDGLTVQTSEGRRRYSFEHAILALGSLVVEVPSLPFDHDVVIDSDDAVELKSVPERLLVVGAGAIGLELGMAYAKLGSKVTLLEAADKLLPMIDPEITRVITRSLKNLGIELILGAKATGVERRDSEAEVKASLKDGEKTLAADRVLVAVGRRPNTRDLGLEEAGVKLDDKGYVVVDERLQTSVKGIYAVGDMVPGPPLAHKAIFQGKIAAEVIAGLPAAYEAVKVPWVLFTDPEVAWVGLTEAEAKQKGYKVKVGTFPFGALGRTLTLGDEPLGFSKVVADAEAGTVLGVHIVGPSATDLIAEGALAVQSASHFEDLALTIHAHPTLAESIEEAAEQVERRAVDIFNPSPKGNGH
jgi:dihydrolipoamide dehydrogenase